RVPPGRDGGQEGGGHGAGTDPVSEVCRVARGPDLGEERAGSGFDVHLQPAAAQCVTQNARQRRGEETGSRYTSLPFGHTCLTRRRDRPHGAECDPAAPGGDNHEPTHCDGGRSGCGRTGARRGDRDNGLSGRPGSRSGRCRQRHRALALPWAVLVSGTVRFPVSAPRVVRHPRCGAWTFLARLVCWWPRLVENRSPAEVRGVASPGTPVPAARRLRPL